MKSKKVAENAYLVKFKFAKERELFLELSNDKRDLMQQIDRKFNKDTEYEFLIYMNDADWDNVESQISSKKLIYSVMNGEESAVVKSFTVKSKAVDFIKNYAKENQLNITSESTWHFEIDKDWYIYRTQLFRLIYEY